MHHLEQTEPSAAWVPMHQRAILIASQAPEDPASIAALLAEVELLMFEVAELLVKVNHQRYDAERAYSRRRNTLLATHSVKYAVTVARAMAEVEAEPEKRAWDDMKALFHHVEDTQKALVTKHIGLAVVNRTLEPLVRSWSKS